MGFCWAACPARMSGRIEEEPSKPDGSRMVEALPDSANDPIISTHWVYVNRSFASFADTPEDLITSSDAAMPSAMALRWFAMPMPVCSMASAWARAATTVLVRSASASAFAASCRAAPS